MEPTSIQEVCEREGTGEEELQTQVPWLGIEEVPLLLSGIGYCLDRVICLL